MDNFLRLSKKDIRLILIVLGALALFGQWWFVARSFEAQTAEVEAEIAELQPVLETRRSLAARAQEYTENSAVFIEIAKTEALRYPDAVIAEDWVRYADGLEKTFAVSIPSMSWTESGELLETFEAKIDADTPRQYLSAYKATLTTTFTMGYGDVKEFCKYVTADRYKTAIDSASFSYDASTGLVSCAFSLSKYAINGGNIAERSVEQNNGTKNPFGTLR